MVSPVRLVGLFLIIFGIFAAAGTALSRRPAPPSLQRAKVFYDAELPERGDHEILDFLAASGDPADAWCLALAEHAESHSNVSDAMLKQLNEPGQLRYKTLFAFVANLNQVSTVQESWPLLRDAGCVLERLHRDAEAIALLKKAEQIHPDPDQRLDILHLVHSLGWKTDFRALMADPLYYEEADPFLRMNYAQSRGEFVLAGYWLIRHQIESYQPGTMIAAAGAGLCWLLLMLQLGRVQNWSWKYTSLVPFALILGGLSAYATVFEISIEQRFFVFERYSPHWLLNLIYAVLGIGLREETLKLLFSLPVILLARKAEPIVVLALASCTGLGFAIEENTQYYAGDWGAVFARFLTANFAHMMWTGMAGLAFTDALKGRTSWGEFFEQLAFVIAMHGLYDFFIIDSTIADLAFFSSLIFIWVARSFFHNAHALRGGQKDKPPLLVTFTSMLGATAGICFIMIAQELGPAKALSGTAYAMAGSFFVSIVFFQEFARSHGRV